MLRHRDTLAGKPITFHYARSKSDLAEVRSFIEGHSACGIDTESTGLNCYRPGWEMRTIQYGDTTDSYVIPERWAGFVDWTMRQPMNWIGHNGPHDIRCIDQYLGYETGVVMAGETYLPSHYKDSRAKKDGGVGHGLKEIACALIDKDAGKWEKALKAEFKQIRVPVPGEFYKSGPNKGLPKTKAALLSEGWALIDPENPAYLWYAAADPLLTSIVYRKYQPIVFEFHELYEFDHRVQLACDRLQRRAIRLDVDYTKRLSRAFTRKSRRMRKQAADYGCENIQSGQQVAETLIKLGATLTEKTDTGQWKTDARIMRGLADDPYSNAKLREFVHCVLVAKQLDKRQSSYTDAMLREMDENERVHPSINSIAARTTRMSVSSPPLQQLPTKDHEAEIMWNSEED